MKRNLLALLLAMALLLGLTACGGTGEEPEDADSTTQETAQPEEDRGEEDTTESAETPVTDDAEDPAAQEDAQDTTQSEGGGSSGSSASNTGTGAQTGGSSGSITGSGSASSGNQNTASQKPAAPEPPAQTSPPEEPASQPTQPPAAESAGDSVDLTAFYDSLAAGENWPGMMAVEGEALDTFYPGLADIAAKQCLVYYSMISATVGEIALVEVESDGDVQAVKDIFQARIDYQVGDETNPGGAWYPSSIEGWQNGSRIVSHGNYVMLIALSEGADDVVSAFDALFA